MVNVFAFLITFIQLVVLATAFYIPWPEIQVLLGAYFSPVYVFFGFLNAALEFTGDISYWLFVGLVYCLIKYFIVARAIISDGIGFCDVSALFMEIIYLVGSTYYIITQAFL